MTAYVIATACLFGLACLGSALGMGKGSSTDFSDGFAAAIRWGVFLWALYLLWVAA
jgi:hypothetical protein